MKTRRGPAKWQAPVGLLTSEAYFAIESVLWAVSVLAPMPVSVAAPGVGAGAIVAVSAGMAPVSEPVPPVVFVSLFGGLHAASPKAVRAANRNVDERFMVTLPWAAPRRHHR